MNEWEWLDTVQLGLTLLTCFACYSAGKVTGVSDAIELLIEEKLLKKSDLEKLIEKSND